MVNYENSLSQRSMASLMLKRQNTQSNLHQPNYNTKLVSEDRDRDRDRQRVFGKNYALDDEYNYGRGSTYGMSGQSGRMVSPGRGGVSAIPRYFNESFNPPRTNENESMRGVQPRMVPTSLPHRQAAHDRIVTDSPPDEAVPEPVRPPKKEIDRTNLTRMRKKYKNKISANISGTKFEIVRHVLESIGCKILPDENFDCNLIWDDTRVSIEGISELKAFQRYNHFPAMSEISKKDALARNISKISKLLPKDFDFVPRTWIMPSEHSNLLAYGLEAKKTASSQQKPNKATFIMKPANGAMGHGIKLYRSVEKIQPNDNFIVQEYIPNPYLIDGFKFDLRIYALVTSCDPLRAFIYNNGLVRLGTEPYEEPHESNIDHLYMHLTNYSVNKRNRNNYDEGDEGGEKGTKRSLKFLFEHLRRNNIDSSKVWRNIQDIILKTLLVAEPYLFHTYKMCRPGQIPGTESVCFEILGFDILLDDKMKPWVLEVNRCPSFGANQQIDFDIKSRLLFDSFELLHLRGSDRARCQVMQKAESKRRLYNLNNSYSSRTDMNSSSLNHYESTKPMMHSLSSSNLMSVNSLPKKFKTKERRKAELIEQIKLMRREQKRQEFENRNLGNFSRLFPKNERSEMDYYLNILNTAFNLFYPVGKHLQWRKTYEKIREDELLNELAECDDSVYDVSDYEKMKKINEYLRDDYMSTETEESENSDSDDDSRRGRDHNRYRDHYNYENDRHRYAQESSLDHNHSSRSRHQDDDDREEYEREESKRERGKESSRIMIEQQMVKSNRVSTLINAIGPSSSSQNKPSLRLLNRNGATRRSESSEVSGEKSSDLSGHLAASLINEIRSHQAKQSAGAAAAVMIKSSSTKGAENESKDDMTNITALNVAVLKLLTQLEIKYPGKTSEESRALLHKIYSKFELYKPKLANYWMAKLDDNKRNKILSIVKSNLVAILRKVFMLEAVESLRLYKIFVKLLNRMLWMHGQGLWNCFISTNNSSWECIFSKSSFQITESEFKCCHRIVQLCKDCVLIVYQYAFEQKPNVRDSSYNSSTNRSSRLFLNSASANKVEL